MYPSTSSGIKTADTAIVTRPCILHSIVMVGGADAAAAIVYDNASAASGTEVAKITAAAGATEHLHDLMAECRNGLYLDITAGTTPAVIIYYSLL